VPDSRPIHLPYTARTRSGDVFEIAFPLHPATGNPVRVSQLLTALLEALDREIGVSGETSNGDVLQALAMAAAIRAAMIEAPDEITGPLARDLLSGALSAMQEATHTRAPSGRA
jgi:hypothetical protein